MKTSLLLLSSIFLLSGCNPFSEKQDAVKQSMQKSQKLANKANIAYTKSSRLRKIKAYKPYTYNQDLIDPFMAKEFVNAQDDEAATIEIPYNCTPPSCVPPAPHPKSLLENYDLGSITFVGTIAGENATALISTPDIGVVQVKVGDYMGKDNGKILEIQKSIIVLQEKQRNGRMWKNKKTILVIKQ